MIEVTEPAERETDTDVVDEIKYCIDRLNESLDKAKARGLRVTLSHAQTSATNSFVPTTMAFISATKTIRYQ